MNIPDFDLQKVESLDYDTISEQLQYIFKTEQDIANFVNFLKNINKFVSLSNDKRHMTLIDLAYFRSQIGKFERQIQILINRAKNKQVKAAMKKGKLAGEKMTENLVAYYSEDDMSLEGLEDLHTLVLAWNNYMNDLYFMCSQTNKIMGNIFS